MADHLKEKWFSRQAVKLKIINIVRFGTPEYAMEVIRLPSRNAGFGFKRIGTGVSVVRFDSGIFFKPRKASRQRLSRSGRVL